MDNKNNKKQKINQDSLIIIGLIMIVIVITSISSYAYITWKSKSDKGSLTTTIGDIAVITFDNGVNINSNTLEPVLNYEDGINMTYSIKKKIDSNVYTDTYLTINEIDNELISDSLKYVLLESNDNNNYEIISEGNFNDIDNNKLLLLDDYKLSIQTTYYKLYIYIDGRSNNNNMKNKNIDVTLNIDATKDTNITKKSSYE
jgi:hypothetical protein